MAKRKRTDKKEEYRQKSDDPNYNNNQNNKKDSDEEGDIVTKYLKFSKGERGIVNQSYEQSEEQSENLDDMGECNDVETLKSDNVKIEEYKNVKAEAYKMESGDDLLLIIREPLKNKGFFTFVLECIKHDKYNFIYIHDVNHEETEVSLELVVNISVRIPENQEIDNPENSDIEYSFRILRSDETTLLYEGTHVLGILASNCAYIIDTGSANSTTSIDNSMNDESPLEVSSCDNMSHNTQYD